MNQSNLEAKIKEITKDIKRLQKKMIFEYKYSEYQEGNFFYKLLVEREKILSKLKSKLNNNG